jgi:hypothetical protein
MSDTFLFNRNLWVAVVPSTLSDNIYVREVPHTLYFHQTQHQAVIDALRGGSDFLTSVSGAMGDGWQRSSPYFKGADVTGVWHVDVMPIGSKFGDTHVARVGNRHLVLFVEVAADEDGIITQDILPPGFTLPE